MGRLPRSIVRIALAAAWAAAPGVSAFQFEGQIDKGQMTADEEVTITLQASGEDLGDDLPEPVFEPSPDFTFLNKNRHQSQSQNITVINGRFSKSLVRVFTFQFTFKPARIGELLTPGFKIEYKGAAKHLAPAKVTVLKESPESRDVELLLHFSKKRIYLNEQVVLTAVIRKKVNSPVQQISPPDLEKEIQKFFWVKPASDKFAGRVENLNGEPFEVFRRDYFVFPLVSGGLKIPSVPLKYTVVERRRGGGRDPFNDPFFNSFFESGQTQTRTKNSTPVPVEVLPLPDAAKPRGFSGAVGVFSLSARADKSEVKAGEPINLTVTVTGLGNEKSVKGVDIRNIDRFEVFDPEIDSKVDVRNRSVAVTKTFKYVLIPQVEGNFPLGPVSIYYFNPEKGRYDSAQASLALTVLPGKAAPVQSGRYLTQEEVRAVGKDIRYIKTDVASLRDQSRRFYRSPVYALTCLFPFFVTTLFLGVRRRRRRLSADVEYARSRSAKKAAARRLAEADGLVRPGPSSAFHAALAKGLYGYLADKLNLSAAGLTRADAQVKLHERGASPASIGAALALLDLCDAARFGNLNDAEADRRRTRDRAADLVARLEKELKR